jgi:hypothetical protein
MVQVANFTVHNLGPAVGHIVDPNGVNVIINPGAVAGPFANVGVYNLQSGGVIINTIAITPAPLRNLNTVNLAAVGGANFRVHAQLN